MALFLISLGMLFAASLLGYLIINHQLRQPQSQFGDDWQWVTITPDLPDVVLSKWLWLSTVILIASSLTAHAMLRNLKRQRQQAFQRWLKTTLVLAVAFLLVQAPCMLDLLREHRALREQSIAIFGLVLFLILLHALHIIGGIIPLSILVHRAKQGRYDHTHAAPVHHTVMYWHFLDAVWLVMFVTLLVG